LQLEPARDDIPAATDGPTSGSNDTPPAPERPAAAIRSLDPRAIVVDRIVNAITGVVVCGTHLVVILVLWLTDAGIPVVVTALAWFPLAALMVWLAVWWPAIDHRRWRYRVDAAGIEIWSGVVWRQAVTVPRSRVQHIDVSQGPIERSYGLATLSVYTAGTEYSRVQLPGLDHGVALAVRDALLPKDVEPAV
jgi:uncharacterized protein